MSRRRNPGGNDVMGLALVAAAGIAVYWYMSNQQQTAAITAVQSLPNTPTTTAASQAAINQSLVGAAGGNCQYAADENACLTAAGISLSGLGRANRVSAVGSKFRFV